MRAFLLRDEDDIFEAVNLQRKIEGKTISFFIRDAIRQKLKYYSEVEKLLYEEFAEKTERLTNPVLFFEQQNT